MGDKNLKKTVLITGASKGIGRATAILFAQKGYNVSINYNKSRNHAQDLMKFMIKNGYSAAAYQADVSIHEQAVNLVKQTIGDFGGLDVIVNNAGIAQTKLFTDITEKDWDNIFDVNIKGMYFVLNAALPFLISQKRGKIINVSSIWGVCGASCEAHYSSAKAAVIGLTKALAKELGPSGINVNCVCPGVIDTQMLDEYAQEELNALKDRTPLGRLGTPEDVAKSIYFLASDNADFITGQILNVDGGFVI
ncbi:MAG TPA: 3-oxoacyl-ACP reductase FabG [Clostridiales bacterium]|nr:3-oxoacyl-ACP reductase FabG [Clostridiales bacterium]